jgi:hypothetical protein
VFAGMPSVWHHEIRAAAACGVAVFGAASMGALRAAELPQHMTPVGLIANKYVSGEWNDDADVALLHADKSDDYRPLTVPQVNVWATLQRAVREKTVPLAVSKKLLQASAAMFYQDRTWERITALLSDKYRASFAQFLNSSTVDQKALDAAECLRVAWAHRGTQSAGQSAVPFSAFVRNNRIGPTLGTASTREAQKTLVISRIATLNGLQAGEPLVRQQLKWLDTQGLAADEAYALAEHLALEAMVLQGAQRFFPDGFSHREAAQLASRLKTR